MNRSQETYHVYVLRSMKDRNLYIGMTSDLQARISSHNCGRVRSTKARRPLKLVYSEEFSSKTEARRRELFLKTGQGRKSLHSIAGGVAKVTDS
jgi:putative endonuclease